MSGFTPNLISNYEFDEVASALQKSIRRGLEYESAYWGYIIHQSGYGMYLFRRLSIIACEDVGLGNPQALILVSSLQQSWLQLHKQNKEASLDKYLLALQTNLYLCRSEKTREGDSLSNLIEEHFAEGKKLEIPDFALDSHTTKGKSKFGRFGNLKDGKEKLRLDNWFNKWAYLNRTAYKDKWEDELKEIWYSRVPESDK